MMPPIHQLPAHRLPVHHPSLELLLPLAQVYRVPIDDLVGAPDVADPRIRLKPRRLNGRTVLPLTPPGRVSGNTVRPFRRRGLSLILGSATSGAPTRSSIGTR